MIRRPSPALLLAVTLTACATVDVSTSATTATIGGLQDAEPDAAPPLDAEAMARAMALMHPGPEHEELAARAGVWDTEAHIYSPMAPGMPPMKQKGSASSKMILGGRFLQITSKGDFMGQTFESIEILGFDRRHEEYTMIGLDTLGTYWVTAKGQRDADGVIRMRGEDVDVQGKQVYVFEYEILGPDEHEYRVLFEQLGATVYEEPFTMVTVRSTRKAD